MKLFIIICLFSLFQPHTALAAEVSRLHFSTADVSTSPIPVTSSDDTPSLTISTSRSLFQQISQVITRFQGTDTSLTLSIVDPKVNTIFTQTLTDEATQVNLEHKHFVPGTYTVYVNQTILTEFSWGVLVINPDQSVYRSNDQVNLALAVLDDQGDMVCDANLELTITTPTQTRTSISTNNHDIIVNPDCHEKNISQLPDYQATYYPKQEGYYHLQLTATTPSGTRTIEDGFMVDDSSPFFVKRQLATRIYPQNIYPVNLVLTAQADFTGSFTEPIPHDFILADPLDLRSYTLSQTQTQQLLTWQINLKAGDSTTLTYFYDAPDRSPDLYLLGPATLKRDNHILFSEGRSWQLASDAIAHEETITGSSDSLSTVVSGTITGTTNHLYLAAVSEKDNQTVSGVSGLGLTWSLVLAQCGARAQTRTEVWYAIGTPSGDGTVTATFSVAPTEATIAVSRYSGINTSSPIGASTSKNSNGVSGGCSGGTDASSYTVDLTTTTANSHAYGAVSLRARTHTAGSGYTERGEVSSPNTPSGSGSGVAVEDKLVASASTVAVDGTLSGVNDYAVVALEIKPFSNSTPSTPTLDSPADTATNQSLTPALLTTATDSNSDYLRYKIELCTNVGMTTGCQTFDQTSSQTGWSGQDTQTSTAYASGTQATYTIQSALSASTTYYWRSYAIDPGGTNNWSSTQTPRSFTTTTAPSSPTTPYTEGATNPTGIIDLTPEFSAIHNDANADAATYYQINVNTASDFTGTSMWDSGTVSMTSTADTVRSPDISYAGTSLSYGGTTYYWRIRFTDTKGAVGAWSTTASFATNSTPSTPTLDSPADTATNQSLTPALLTTATDSNSDYLRYKIELCTNVGMTTGCQTFDQTSSQTGWSGQDTQTSTAYASGTQATYTIQSALSASTTYYWRSYAIDPGGTNTWSSTQTPRSFTTTTGGGGGGGSVEFSLEGVSLEGISIN